MSLSPFLHTTRRPPSSLPSPSPWSCGDVGSKMYEEEENGHCSGSLWQALTRKLEAGLLASYWCHRLLGGRVPSLCSSFPLFPPHLLMAVVAAAGLTVTYCIRGMTQEPARRSVFLAFPLSRLYQQRQMPCCKSFHRNEFFIHLFISFFLFSFFFYLAAFLSSDTLTWNHTCSSRVQT